jgi:hypothetical protein
MTTRTMPLHYCGFLFCLLSCDSPRSTQPQLAEGKNLPITVDTTTVLGVSQLVDSVRLIPLQTAPGQLIGEIAKICIAPDHRFFILDGISHKIFVFDPSGRFLFPIDRSGIGPGRCKLISDLQIDRSNNTLGIIDPLQSKFLRLDLNGNLLNEYPLVGATGIAKFAFLPTGDIAFSRGIPPDRDNLQYSIQIMSGDLKLKKRLLKYDRSSSAVLSANYPFQSFDGGIFYLPSYRDEIDRVDSAATQPEYRLDFGDKWITPDFAYEESHTSDNLWTRTELPASGFVYYINYAMVGTNMLIYYTYKGRDYLNVVDTRTGAGRNTRLSKDFSILGFSGRNTNVCDDSTYIAYVSDLSKIPQLEDRKMAGIFTKLAADSTRRNPVLLFISFKKIL